MGGLHEAAIRLEANVPGHGLRDVLPSPRCSKHTARFLRAVTGLIGAASTFEVCAYLFCLYVFGISKLSFGLLPNAEHYPTINLSGLQTANAPITK